MEIWRTLSTETLTNRAEALEELGEFERAEEIWQELEERDAQAEANAGGMNGVAPEF